MVGIHWTSPRDSKLIEGCPLFQKARMVLVRRLAHVILRAKASDAVAPHAESVGSAAMTSVTATAAAALQKRWMPSTVKRCSARYVGEQPHARAAWLPRTCRRRDGGWSFEQLLSQPLQQSPTHLLVDWAQAGSRLRLRRGANNFWAGLVRHYLKLYVPVASSICPPKIAADYTLQYAIQPLWFKLL